MAQFQELIKNFDRIRDYMRQFYVYGFKVRGEFTEKSTRTYDNERRRIESWLSGCISSDYTAKGKQICISADSRSISSNPLYSAWKSKSFTDNDLLLHFFVLHYLMQHRKAEQTAEGGQTEQAVSGTHPGMTAEAMADQISADFGCFFDSRTVRLKLKEYENLGLLSSVRHQKSVYYKLAQPMLFEQPEFFTDSTSGFSQQSPSFQRQLPSVLLEIPFWNGSIRRTPASVLSTISWFTPWKTAFYYPILRQFTAAAVWSLKITAREVETLPSSGLPSAVFRQHKNRAALCLHLCSQGAALP